MNGLANTLSWVLIHSLWISASIWLISSAVQFFMSSSSWRRLIKSAAFILFYVLIIIAFAFELPQHSSEVINWMIFEDHLFLNQELSFLDRFTQLVSSYSFIIASFWLLGTGLGIFRLTRQREDLRIIKSKSNTIDGPMQKIASELAQKLQIKKNVQVMESHLINSPMTTGFLKPIIYLPIGLTTGLTHDEIESILLHELAHIKRSDYLLNWILVITETLFFFNPVVLIMIKELRREMEFTCDDEVLHLQNKISYARTLVKLEEFNLQNKIALQAKNNNSEFSKRINRMIKQQKPVAHHKIMISALLVLTLFISSAFTTSSLNGNEVEPDKVEIEKLITQGQDTLNFTSREAMVKKIKEMDSEDFKGVVIMLNGEQIRVIKDKDNALKKADEMMEEIQEELVKDGILNENRTKITLMFQYSDVLNGEKSLGDHYEKYKGILNRYFPVYDSFATTRVFRYKKD